MEKGNVIGHQMCPECDLWGAEIKIDKSGHPYRWCPDCNAQYFTRGDPRRVENLKRKMTAAASPEPEAKAATPASSPKVPSPDPAMPAAKKKPAFSLGDL